MSRRIEESANDDIIKYRCCVCNKPCDLDDWMDTDFVCIDCVKRIFKMIDEAKDE